MRILVADDEDAIARLIAEVLKEMNYEVEVVYNGRDAIQAVRYHAPDLVISDVMMPHASGVELVRIMRSQPWTVSTPVILMSAAVTPDISDSNVEFIAKPFNLDAIVRSVDETLRGQ